MYTVLLTDDEVSVIDSLKSSISWSSLGVEEIFTASDGIQALELFRTHRIDLMITDIKMPRMDGISLLEQVRAHYPNTHCILLTAYGEFEYARSALRLGVENYLLKPMQMKEITETIENAIDNMYARRENKELLFRENVLRRWVNGTISGDELVERANILDINIYQSAYCVVGMKKISGSVSLSAYGGECARRLRPDLDCYPVWDNNGRFLLILSGSSIPLPELGDILQSTAERLDLLGKVTVAAGSVAADSDDLSLSYQSACDLIERAEKTAQSRIQIVSDEHASKNAVPSIDLKSLSPIIQKAITYIHTGYAQGVSIKEFCAGHTMTTAYIGYLFKKETNVFFNNYLTGYRIGKAIGLLTSTQLKINEIAARTGFSNTSYFISSFRKFTGVSPQKYREQHS